MLTWRQASSTALVNASLMLLIAETSVAKKVSSIRVNNALVSQQAITSDTASDEGVCSGHNDSVSASSAFTLSVCICCTSMSTSTCLPSMPYCLNNHSASTVSIEPFLVSASGMITFEGLFDCLHGSVVIGFKHILVR